MGPLRALAIGVALATTMPSKAGPRSPWTAYVAEASTRFGVPQAWIWRAMAIESGGRTTLAGRPIRSPKGAMGLMQLMPATWASLRIAYGLGTDPDDPRDNILAGTAYLRLMYDRFGYPGLFGAYNAGPARYSAYLLGGRLPAETSAYLERVDVRPSVPRRAGPRPPDPSALFAVRTSDIAREANPTAAPARSPLFAIVAGVSSDASLP